MLQTGHADPAVDRTVWQQECVRSQQHAERFDLDDTSLRDGQECSLRWIYTHLIEQYARRNGHADRGRAGPRRALRAVRHDTAATFESELPTAAEMADRWACEVSVYLVRGHRRTGGGRLLYEALLARLAERGFRTAVAGLTLPNDASAGRHRALDFQTAGTSRRIGWKHGRWHDVAWVQRSLGDDEAAPVPLR